VYTRVGISCVPFNQVMIDHQNRAIEQFWNAVQSDTKPDWDGSESTYNAVRRQYEDIDGTEVELGQLGFELVMLQTEADQTYYRLMQKKSEVLDKMGSAKWGVLTDDKSTRRIASRQLRAGVPSLIVNKKGM
jgi:hypothetical protein